jgi:predicted DNA-binding helix-hairpin-helix protein
MVIAALGLLLLTIVLPATWNWWITPTRARPLELNTAPEAALRRLPRMNPKLLHAIIEARLTSPWTI